jgi:hypothetical protein
MSNEETAIIYNVTVKVDAGISDLWLNWLVNEHIPLIMETGCFTSYQVVRLLEVDDTDGPTFAIQYRASSKADYNRYLELHAPSMRKLSLDKWGDRFIAFRSLMEVLH